MNRIVKINKEQYDSLVQIEEFLTSNIYATGNDYIDESILEDVSAIIKEYERKVK